MAILQRMYAVSDREFIESSILYFIDWKIEQVELNTNGGVFDFSSLPVGNILLKLLLQPRQLSLSISLLWNLKSILFLRVNWFYSGQRIYVRQIKVNCFFFSL